MHTWEGTRLKIQHLGVHLSLGILVYWRTGTMKWQQCKWPLPLVECHNLFTSTVFMNWFTLTFLDTEFWISGTIGSTYSSYPSCLHKLRGPNTLISSLDPHSHSHSFLYHVVGTSWLPRPLILVTSRLSYPFCFLCVDCVIILHPPVISHG